MKLPLKADLMRICLAFPSVNVNCNVSYLVKDLDWYKNTVPP